MDHIRIQIIVLFLAGIVQAQDSTLIEFELEDQFKTKYSHSQFHGQVLIVVGSDREGSGYNELWGRAIYDSLEYYQLQDSVTFLAVADVKGVPRLFRGFVRGKFLQNMNHPILLDWKGDFSGAYQYQGGYSNILLFNRSGKLIHQFFGKEPGIQALKGLLGMLVPLFQESRLSKPDSG